MIRLISAKTMVLLCLALVAVQLLLAVLALWQVQEKAAYLVLLALYPAAIALALRPAGRRLPAGRTVAVLLYVAAINAVVPWTLQGGAWDGYALWNLSSSYTLLVILVLRQRAVAAWTGVLIQVLAMIWWAAPGPPGVLGGLLFTTATLGWTAVAGGIAHLLDSSDAKIAQYTADAAAAALRQDTETALDATRAQWIRHVRRLAGGILSLIADESHVLTEDEKREMRMLEARLRDEIRGRALATGPLLAAAQQARERGVEVQLLDDRNEELDAGFLERVGQAVLETLVAARAGEVTVRVRPGGPRATVGILVRPPGPGAEPVLRMLSDGEDVTRAQ